MSRRNFYSSLVVLAFFAFFYVMSGELSSGGSYWPRLICILGGTLAALNALSSALKMRKEVAVPLFPLTGAQLKRGVAAVALVALWLAAVPLVGYLVASLAVTLALVLLFEPLRDKRHVLRDVIITVVFSLAIYKLFSMLDVYFPESLLF